MGKAKFFNLFRKSEMGEDLRVFFENTFADNDSVHIISRNNAMRPEVKWPSSRTTHLMTPASCKSSLYRSLNLYFLLTPFEQYF
ncbi:MAG TPA: hypothetical protein VF783_12390 [Terriglobales bacterium]